MRSSTLPSNSRPQPLFADAPANESKAQRRARLQALLKDVTEVHRLAAIELAQTQRVAADCETAVTRLSAMLEELTGEPDTAA